MEKASGIFSVVLFLMLLLTVVQGLVIFKLLFVCPTVAGLKQKQ